VVQVEARTDSKGHAASEGSGFLVGTKDLIATNYHVIKDAYSAHVVFADKTELQVLGVAAMDPGADVAIVKLASQAHAQPLELAGGDLPPVGTKVYAIGSPLGAFANTLSDGLVSAHRERGKVPYFPQMPAMIQTTAPTSKGSSGGPLLTADGKVVGLTTLGFAPFGGQNLNLAVPVCHVRRLLQQYGSTGRLTDFPLPRQPAVGRPNLVDGWPPEDLDNAVHFVRALRAVEKAWAVCRATGHTGKPWLLGAGFPAFARLIEEANREAKLVSADVLKRMHPRLPDAFYDFIASTGHMGHYWGLKDKGVRDAWERWAQWWQANAVDVHVPKGALQ
jgi:hypothetical protein